MELDLNLTLKNNGSLKSIYQLTILHFCFFSSGSWHSVIRIVWNWQWILCICVRLKSFCLYTLLQFRGNNFLVDEVFVWFPYRENAGLLALTRVGSRRVVQISAGFMIFFSILGELKMKLSAVLVILNM